MHPDILIDITMTAVRRPELLKRTLHSFFKNCFAPIMNRCRLVINIDPIGDAIPSHELVPIIGGFFKHYYVHLPMMPSFPHAFKWVWQHASAPFVFHLEDDWELLAPVDIIHMIRMLEDFPGLASLRLPFFPSSDREMKNWNLFFPWNGHYFECPANLRKTAGFAGHPSLLRGDFVRECAPLIDINLNPEKQFHGDNDPLVTEVLRWQYGVYSQPNSPKILKDIGALWKAENNFQKAGSKAFFTQWEQTT